jgi:predicted amidohydrolase YtcJ
MAIRDGRILAVGDDSLTGLAGPRTRLYDAGGRTVTPGFIDCHNHTPGETLLYEVLVGNPYEVEFVTLDSIIAKLRARAAIQPPGVWVEGYFFDDTKVKDGRELNVHDLDKVSTTQAVAVYHRGGHTAYFNSRALALAGIGADTPNPSGGTYDRFADGSLNGRVTDRGLEAFRRVVVRPQFSPQEQARRAEAGQAHISKMFVTYGLTGVCHEGGDLRAIQTIRARGDLKHRVSYEAWGEDVDKLIAMGVETGLGDEWIRFGATAEHTEDGSFSERTMALSRPFPGRSPPYYGNLIESQEALDAWVDKVHAAGLQPNCHANGDVAIDHVLTAYERAKAKRPEVDVRWKITHCSLVNASLLARIKALGVSPALFSTYAYYNGDKFHFYGAEMMDHMMAYRDMLDLGIPACAGSDFDPGPFAPMMALQAMVTRKGWNGEIWGARQRISVEEALRVNTINGAYDTHEEAIKGSLTPGKLADFVVLSDDPRKVDPDRLKDIQILQTVVGGQVMFQA